MEVGHPAQEIALFGKSFKSPALQHKDLSCLPLNSTRLSFGHSSRAQRNPQFREGNRIWMEMGLCLFLTQSSFLTRASLFQLSTLYPCEVALNCVCSSSLVIYCPLSRMPDQGITAVFSV